MPPATLAICLAAALFAPVNDTGVLGQAAPPAFLVWAGLIVRRYAADREPAALVRRSRQFTLAALAVLALPLVRIAPAMLRYPHELDFGEPFVYRGALLLTQGRSPYVPWEHPVGGVAALYPPLFYAVAAALLRVLPPGIYILRAVTACCGIGVLTWIWRLVYGRTGSWASSLAGCLFVLGTTSAPFMVLGRVDVAGVLLTLIGFSVAMRGVGADGGIPRRRLVQSAGLFALAVLTKQTLVAAPAAVGLYLVTRRAWRGAILFAASCAVPLIVATVLLDRLTGARYVFIVYGLQTYFGFSVQRLADVAIQESARLLLLPIIPGLIWLWRERHEGRTRLIGFYAILAAAQVVAIGKPGSGYNYLLEAHVILAVLLGLAFGTMRLRPSRWAVALPVILMAGSTVLLAFDHGIAGARQSALEESRSAERALMRVLDRHPGPMLSAEPYHLIERGQPERMVEWLIHRLPLPGTAAGWASFLKDLEAQRYKTIVIVRQSDPARDLASDTLLSDEALAIVAGRYRNLRRSELLPDEAAADPKYWVLVPCEQDCGFDHFDPMPPPEPRFYRRLLRRLAGAFAG